MFNINYLRKNKSFILEKNKKLVKHCYYQIFIYCSNLKIKHNIFKSWKGFLENVDKIT